MESLKQKSTETHFHESDQVPINKDDNSQLKYKKRKIENPSRKNSLRKTTLSAPNYHIPTVSRHQYNMAKVKPHHKYKKNFKKIKDEASNVNPQSVHDPRLFSKLVHPKNVFESKFVEKYEGREVGYGKLVESMISMFEGRKGKVIGMRVLPDKRVQHLTQ